MSDWKSWYGVSDEGAAQAGVYGKPNSMYEVGIAQEATNRINMERAAESTNFPSYAAPPPIVYHNPTDYGPSAPSHLASYHATPSAKGSGLKFLVIMGGLAAVGASAYFAWPVVMSEMDAYIERVEATERRVLDTAFYTEISPSAAEWATIPTSRLYAMHLDGQTSNWRSLNQNAKRAVEAAWIRYTIDPASFERLPASQRSYVYATFDSYLLYLSDLSLRQGAMDLEHFRQCRGCVGDGSQ